MAQISNGCLIYKLNGGQTKEQDGCISWNWIIAIIAMTKSAYIKRLVQVGTEGENSPLRNANLGVNSWLGRVEACRRWADTFCHARVVSDLQYWYTCASAHRTACTAFHMVFISCFTLRKRWCSLDDPLARVLEQTAGPVCSGSMFPNVRSSSLSLVHIKHLLSTKCHK